MTDVGYALSSEEFGPNELVDNAAIAEEAGFDFVSISDHFHPWLESQGESPFVWSTLGGIARATDDIEVGVGVTCPIIRIHPANVAHAAATAATMMDGRFFFGVGTGELLNEHVTGERWPPHRVRLEMLKEAVHVVRKLWTGEEVNHHGDHFTVENAKLYTLPDDLPPIVVSAFGEKTARAAAEFADGLWSSGPQGELVEQYRGEGGDGLAISQLTACYADSEDEAVSTAHEYWRQSALPGELNQILPTPTHFEQATQTITEDDIREGSLLVDRDPDAHVENLQQFVDAGYEKVYVHQVGEEQEKFLRFYEDEVLPSFR